MADADAGRRGRRRIRLGFVGAEHPHFRGLIASALASPTVELAGVSIADGELRAYLAGRYPNLDFFPSDEALYEHAGPEAIVTCADNRRSAAVVVDAAERGLHAMTEKPMAADLALARSMLAAAEANRTRLMVNWSTNWRPAVHLAKRLVDDQRVGRLLGIQHRAGHGGPPRDYLARDPDERVAWSRLVDPRANGGGAAVDFCCYGAAISCWLMGLPSSVVAVGGRYAKDFLAVEDNAVMVLCYPRGHSLAEGTWTEVAAPVRHPTMLYGEEGTIAITTDSEVRVGRRGTRGGDEVVVIEADPLPMTLRSGPDHFSSCLLDDLPFEGLASARVALDAQSVVEAGLRSISSGRRVELPL